MRTVPATIIAVFAIMALSAAACGSNGSSAQPTTVDEALVDLDPNLLTTVALQPEDVPPGYVMAQGFNPVQLGGAKSFARTFQNNGVSIISSVAKYPDIKARDEAVAHLRKALTRLIGPESTFIVPGSNAAFEYKGGPLPAQGTAMLLGRYIVSVTYSTQNLDAAAAVSDQAELERVSKIVFGRLQTLLADPSAATPAQGAPTFDAGPPATAQP